MTDTNGSPKPELILTTEPNTLPAFDIASISEPDIIPVSADSLKNEESRLTPEEIAIIKEFAGKIDITNVAQITQYGASSQQKMAQFSESALENVRTKDMEEIGKMITGLVGELKGFSDEEGAKGLFGLFKKPGKKAVEIKARYDKVEKNVDKICDVLESHKITLLKDIALLDKMFELNLTYFKELTMYILAGRQKLQEVYEHDLPAAQEKAKQSGALEDAQAANYLADMCNQFDKKLLDLDLTRMISLQMAPQIRMIQSNDSIMVEKIQSSIVNTIPLWKNQMVLSLGLAHSKQAIEAQRKVTDVTNELLRKNADMLKISAIETAQESERSIVDLETLRYTNESLITTLDEVMRLQQEGKLKRRDAETELERIESELKSKLLELKGTPG